MKWLGGVVALLLSKVSAEVGVVLEELGDVFGFEQGLQEYYVGVESLLLQV